MIILDMLEPYLQELQARNYSQETINRRVYSLRSFIHFLSLREIVLVDQLNVDVLEEYKNDLTFRYTEENKSKKLSAQTRRGYLSVVRSFCEYLHDKELLVGNPAANLVMPKIPKKLPKVILTLTEIRKLIDACDRNSNRGCRNRIIIEILYDTGIRGSELCGINTDDLDLAAGFLHITGKGDKDRVVPVSSRVCDLIRRYKMLIRPAFARSDDDGTLILNRYGKMFNYKGILKIVKRYGKKAGLNKNITCHVFRHACATHMLQNGANIRVIQELLGHDSLATTQIYTRLTIKDLKEAHDRFHPRESWQE